MGFFSYAQGQLTPKYVVESGQTSLPASMIRIRSKHVRKLDDAESVNGLVDRQTPARPVYYKLTYRVELYMDYQQC